MTGKFRTLTGLALVAMSGIAACDDMTAGSGDATLRVLLTDAAADYVAAANVDIGVVELIPAGAEGAPIVLSTDGTEGPVDLLTLQNAATAALAQAEIEAGTYAQLRLIVESASVELEEGFTFADGSTGKDLFIPSGAQTGIKLNLGGADGEDGQGIVISSGETVLVLDFDVNQSFVVTGAAPMGETGTIQGMLFTPTLRVTAEDVAASISGTVSTDLSGVSVEGLIVTAEPADAGTVEEYQTSTATAMVNPDGTYTIHFLVPGSYSVSVAGPEGTVGNPASVPVTVGDSEDAVGVDFTIVEEASAG